MAPRGATRAAPQTAARRIEPRPSRRAPVPSAPPAAAAPARRRPSALRRALPALVILALAAAAIAFALSWSGPAQSVRLRPIDGADARQTVDQLRQLVDDNTR